MEVVAEKSKKKMPTKYKNVASVIPVGKDKAIILDDIMTFCDIKDKRDAYLIIESLIIKYGHPIVASKTDRKGYFYPSNEAELKQAADTLKSSITSLKKRHDALQENFKKFNQDEV